jgi:hypothetical protein
MSELLCTGTVSTGESEVMTLDKLNEAMALIKALAPKEAPEGLGLIKGATGLNIMKNDMLPENTVMVSKRLFDMIYESST